MKRKIGIYGGTFSPPHLGHIHAAKAFLEAEKLDKLMIIPTCIPPHKIKKDNATDIDRLAMCRLAFSFLDAIEVSDMEMKRGGKSYTSDTLSALKSEKNELYFLCGSDMFLTLPDWHEPKTVFSLATIVCLTREKSKEVWASLEKAKEAYIREYQAKIHLLTIEAKEVSSSEIRQRCQNGEQYSDLVPSSVADYIEEKRLYR
ncbi:MAG: nicotinate (nicotinamide) nucleotide adenylyltransferase [Clostridia bacterium]|nr:nicotinate (nicotinamide) nucleotide adenylyltransferase [Clostridia bacterium]